MKLYLNKNKQAGSVSAEYGVICSVILVVSFLLTDAMDTKIDGFIAAINNAAATPDAA
jgi:hypothetical protein